MRDDQAIFGSDERDVLTLDAGPVRRSRLESVGVLETDTERRLVAVRPIAVGELVLHLNGTLSAIPTRYSVQVGTDLHLHSNDEADDRELVEQYAWRYMNHHCEPNTVIRHRDVFAIRAIAVGEDVTFDYNTTEYDMASPFDCHCGSPVCVGVVRGARHLTADQRARIERWLPAYLR